MAARYVRQIVAIDTAANFTSANATLEPGVIGLESDTGKFKVAGTGANWTALSYASVSLPISQSDVTNLTTDLSGKASTVHVHNATTDITSGTVPTDRLGSGTANSTTILYGDQTYKALAVNATTDIASGTVPTARLGTGTANSTTFLRGDQSYAVPSTATSPMTTAADSGAGPTIGNSEVQVSANLTINVPTASSKVLILARLQATKDTGTTARTVTARVRRGATNSDPQVGSDSIIRSQPVASTEFGPAVIMAVDTPGSSGNITYSLRAVASATSAATTPVYAITGVVLQGVV